VARRRLTALELIASAFDEDSWESWDEPVTDPANAGPAYREALKRAREQTGVDEAPAGWSPRSSGPPARRCR
jgi:acetyl-CoA carboxylase beta subunit